MTVHIYNTMARAKEPFIPQQPGKVKMYVCGPTVYDYIHIGNGRPAIVFDVVRRYLEAVGLEVRYIVNFTDVDDKLIRKAEQLGTDVPTVAQRYIDAFKEDTAALGIREATINPRVMDHMVEIIAFIAELVDKGFAYESEGDVYFRTGKFLDYGKLSHQNMEELQFGIRIEVDVRKENPQDFVLWKGAKPGEINWDSPWGAGRPGWHIECSAMARKYLGDTLDIHGGGHDLQFPHHECEIAQSEALTSKPLSNYWMHNGYIHINNEKMSKSLGNGITVRELLKTVKPAAVRYFMLSAHYRSPLNFSAETIAQAENSIERIALSEGNVRHRLQVLGGLGAGEAPTVADIAAARAVGDEEIDKALAAIHAQFHAKMDDDFNTPDAITAVFELVSMANRYLQLEVVKTRALAAILELFAHFDRVLGLLPLGGQEGGLADAEIEQLIEERNAARKAKNWARADEVRDLLASQDIVLEDTAQGIRWRRK